ncbi:Imm52 family immunity protein [Collimonas silvisoli]|uniref:Imm52 family immunity protein n=1 Tax=Collimonas silvisoli TaxID=2825884 RepID=UPI001B8D9EE7|nr:Imm52 family immunity protein [Collimonas silvisoli]
MDFSHLERIITLRARFSEKTPHEEVAIRNEMNRYVAFVKELATVHPDITGHWYVNNGKDEKPPYSNPFPNTTTEEKLIQQRIEDSVESYLLWNGLTYKDSRFEGDPSRNMSLSLDCFSLDCEISDRRCLATPQVDFFINLVQIVLKHFSVRSLSVWPDPLFEKMTFQHRVKCGWVHFAPAILTAKHLPEAEMLIPINNALNQGTIIVATRTDFVGKEPELIDGVNKIAMRLVDMELLPLITAG